MTKMEKRKEVFAARLLVAYFAIIGGLAAIGLIELIRKLF